MKNFKVRCVKMGDDFTVGRIYEVKEGYLMDDIGYKYGKDACNKEPFESVEEINRRLLPQFELVEEKKTPFEYLLEYYDIKVGEVFKFDGEEVYFDEEGMLRYKNCDFITGYCQLTDLVNCNGNVEKIPWKPKNGDTVWMIFSDGGVHECFFSKSSPSNVAMFKLGWIFQTKEEAEANKERVFAEMKEVLNGTD